MLLILWLVFLKGCEIAGVELIGGETAEHFRQRDMILQDFVLV